MTGYRADFADGQNSRIPVNVLYPSLGSVISRELGPRGPVPVYVNVPNPMQAGAPAQGAPGTTGQPVGVMANPNAANPAATQPARAGDLEQAVYYGRRAIIDGTKKSLPSLLMASQELAHTLRHRYPSAKPAQEFLEQLHAPGVLEVKGHA